MFTRWILLEQDRLRALWGCEQEERVPLSGNFREMGTVVFFCLDATSRLENNQKQPKKRGGTRLAACKRCRTCWHLHGVSGDALQSGGIVGAEQPRRQRCLDKRPRRDGRMTSGRVAWL